MRKIIMLSTWHCIRIITSQRQIQGEVRQSQTTSNRGAESHGSPEDSRVAEAEGTFWPVVQIDAGLFV
jgi:hypothetical protein